MGFGRTGNMFACEHAGGKVSDIADFVCLSKGITGGYLPLSAVLTTDTIYQAFYHDSTIKGFLHSHSYTGNPLACSAALATLSIFEADDVLCKNRTTSAYIQQKMQALTHLPIKHLRHQGMLHAFDVKTSNATFARDCYAAAMQHGLLIRPIGNMVYFMPPYSISQTEVDMMIENTLIAVEQSK
jgi:adenosylmethionine---8-amino-7-oxononanoate aminotransferase